MTDTNVSSLHGLNAVVTGSAQGLGLGIAEELGRRGARLTMADVQGEKVQKAAARLEEKGLRAEAACLDITDSRAVREFFKEFAGSRQVEPSRATMSDLKRWYRAAVYGVSMPTASNRARASWAAPLPGQPNSKPSGEVLAQPKGRGERQRDAIHHHGRAMMPGPVTFKNL